MTLIPESLKSILKRHDGGSAGGETVIGAVAGVKKGAGIGAAAGGVGGVIYD